MVKAITSGERRLALHQVLEQQPAGHQGQSPQQQTPAQARVAGVVILTNHRSQPGVDDIQDLRAKVPEHGQQCAEMHGHVERQSLIGPAQETRHQDQVGGAGNGQEFGEALHQGEQTGLQQIHGQSRLGNAWPPYPRLCAAPSAGVATPD